MFLFSQIFIYIIVLTMAFLSSTKAFLNKAHQKVISRPSLRVSVPSISTQNFKYSIISRPILRDEFKDFTDFRELIARVERSANANLATPSSSNFDLYSFIIFNAVAVIWGSQHVDIDIDKYDMDAIPLTSIVNFWRVLISSILFSPSLIQHFRAKRKLESGSTDIKQNGIMRAGMELGFYTFLSFAFQAIGLETTTTARGAFMLYLKVNFVPIMSFLFFQKQYPISTWASALLVFLGTAVLSMDGGSLPNTGDAWCVAAAGASAMFILRVRSFANRFDAPMLNSISFTTGIEPSSFQVFLKFHVTHAYFAVN
jgi:drug/metabolite transporter (DMT)-like permease